MIAREEKEKRDDYNARNTISRVQIYKPHPSTTTAILEGFGKHKSPPSLVLPHCTHSIIHAITV